MTVSLPLHQLKTVLFKTGSQTGSEDVTRIPGDPEHKGDLIDPVTMTRFQCNIHQYKLATHPEADEQSTWQ